MKPLIGLRVSQSSVFPHPQDETLGKRTFPRRVQGGGQWPWLTQRPRGWDVTVEVGRTGRCRGVWSKIKLQDSANTHFTPLIGKVPLLPPGETADVRQRLMGRGRAPSRFFTWKDREKLSLLSFTRIRWPGRHLRRGLVSRGNGTTHRGVWAAEGSVPTPWRTHKRSQSPHPSRPRRLRASPISVAWGGTEFT